MLKSGEHLGPAEIGLLATVGVTAVKVNNSLLVIVAEYARVKCIMQHS